MMHPYYYPEPPLEPNEPEPVVAYHCQLCGADIFVGDEFYKIPTFGPCCIECISDARQLEAEAEEFVF